MSGRINGMGAEQQFRKLVVDTNRVLFTETLLTKEYVIEHILSNNPNRYYTCLSGVKGEFGEEWEEILTAEDVLDYFYAIDFLVSYKGYVFAIDVSTNPNLTQDKVTKMRGLKSLYDSLTINSAKPMIEIDTALVVEWQVQTPYGKMLEVDKKKLQLKLIQVLDTAIRSKVYGSAVLS